MRCLVGWFTQSLGEPEAEPLQGGAKSQPGQSHMHGSATQVSELQVTAVVRRAPVSMAMPGAGAGAAPHSGAGAGAACIAAGSLSSRARRSPRLTVAGRACRAAGGVVESVATRGAASGRAATGGGGAPCMVSAAAAGADQARTRAHRALAACIPLSPARPAPAGGPRPEAGRGLHACTPGRPSWLGAAQLRCRVCSDEVGRRR